MSEFRARNFWPQTVQPFGPLGPFGTLVLPQPHARAAAVLVDELDPCFFESSHRVITAVANMRR